METIQRAILAAAILSASAALNSCSEDSSGDVRAPTVVISAPANFASGLAGIVTFSANVTDAISAPSVEFQVDGVAVGAAQTSAPFSVSVDTNAYASGQHVLRVRATAAGNTSAWTSVTVSFGGNRKEPAGFTHDGSYVTNLGGDATAFAEAPDGRIFVLGQGGTMQVVTKNGALLPTPFLTLTVDSAVERGLLGIAFHPNFLNNQLVYAYYTTPGPPTHNRISRFTAAGDVVMPGSEEILVELPELDAGNHNGGGIHFGADGKLYAGVGENGVMANSQDLSTPLGKLLRFNADGSIPADNPFFKPSCTTPVNLACAVWAYGLRNPFTFAVQPGTGRIHINDVGGGEWEEINLGVAGANYGWPNTEGPTTAAGITGPLFAYRHSATNPPGSGPGGFFTGCAITGGAFYPNGGPFPPAYGGSYFFADLCSAFVARFDLANNAVYSFGAVTGAPVDMLVASDGALLVLTRGTIERFTFP